MTLNEFLMAAKQACYASETPENRIEHPDGSIELRYAEAGYEYVDHYWGDRAFAGTESVSFEGRPVWTMAYHGRVLTSIPEPETIFAFLRKALRSAAEDSPLRGPEYITDENWSYENEYEGDPDEFAGSESIYFKGTRCFQLRYLGGNVER